MHLISSEISCISPHKHCGSKYTLPCVSALWLSSSEINATHLVASFIHIQLDSEHLDLSQTQGLTGTPVLHHSFHSLVSRQRQRGSTKLPLWKWQLSRGSRQLPKAVRLEKSTLSRLYKTWGVKGPLQGNASLSTPLHPPQNPTWCLVEDGLLIIICWKAKLDTLKVICCLCKAHIHPHQYVMPPLNRLSLSRPMCSEPN